MVAAIDVGSASKGIVVVWPSVVVAGSSSGVSVDVVAELAVDASISESKDSLMMFSSGGSNCLALRGIMKFQKVVISQATWKNKLFVFSVVPYYIQIILRERS